jgi:hypothetical protein
MRLRASVGEGSILTKPIALQKFNHLPHRRALDVEAFGKSVHRSASQFVQGRQEQKLRNVKARWLPIGIVLTQDDLQDISDAASRIEIEGERYAPQQLAMVGREAPPVGAGA